MISREKMLAYSAHVKRITDNADDISNALSSIDGALKNPGIISCIRAVITTMNVWNSLKNGRRTVNDFIETKYRGHSWIHVFAEDTHALIAGIFSRKQIPTDVSISDNANVQIIDYGDCAICWEVWSSTYGIDKKTTSCGRLWVLDQNIDKIYDKLREFAWDGMGKHALFRSQTKENGMIARETRLAVVNDVETKTFPSKLADAERDSITKYIGAGVNRAILYYGPPGAGKSTVIRTIVHQLQMRSVRIQLDSVSDIEAVSQIIQIFAPDCVILDDIDKANRNECFYEMMERLKKNVKLVLLSANWTDEFDCAEIRPERIDKMVKVETLDPEAIARIVGDELAGMEDKIGAWPVAYINELKLRRQFEDDECFAQSFEELKQRCERDSEIFKSRNVFDESYNKNRHHNAVDYECDDTEE